MRTISLGCVIHYSGQEGSVAWEGRAVTDSERFATYIREVVAPRVTDADSGFEPDLVGFATTGMATEFVSRLLKTAPRPEGWAVGEALAECAL